MGKRVIRHMLTRVRRVDGHDVMGPSGVPDQSRSRMSRPITLPPRNTASHPSGHGAATASPTGSGAFCSFVGRLRRGSWVRDAWMKSLGWT
ncbi:hypothetical protein ASNO1_51630 [Corallococcus caeni]|uniref:Uncharacterized protein n=1 Tax=Corallococcus caeni TaxID=3082388 RepID=A0ABQ6QY20_9BACT|nr:hypothetical protein ASNO1_51630 [Corallococcus sp. NO1]